MNQEVWSSFTKVSEDEDGKGSENRNKSEDLPVSDFVTCGERVVIRRKIF
jgi:hypothetical protein